MCNITIQNPELLATFYITGEGGDGGDVVLTAVQVTPGVF